MVGGPSWMSNSCREALSYVREWSGDPPSCSGVVEALSDVWELSGIPPGSLRGQPGVQGMVSRMFLRGGKPFRMSGSCRVALPDVREAVPVVREWSGGPLGCPGVFGRPFQIFGRPSQMFESGREIFPDVQEWSRGPPRYPGVVRRPSQMSGSVREVVPDVREWSEGPPGCTGVAGRPSRMS